jgi:hypothetical protein
MASGRDEVEKRVHAVVAESWVPLDARLFGENVIVLAFQIPNNLGEALQRAPPLVYRNRKHAWSRQQTHLASLSI